MEVEVEVEVEGCGQGSHRERETIHCLNGGCCRCWVNVVDEPETLVLPDAIFWIWNEFARANGTESFKNSLYFVF